MLQHYSLALLPCHHSLAEFCTGFAQENFSKLNDGYILGPQALPHITLCRFMAEPSQLDVLWQETANRCGGDKLTLGLSQIYFGKGKAEHQGYIWAGFAVTRDAKLSMLQASIYALLRLQGLTPLILTGDAYLPHMTLARLRGANLLPSISWPEPSFWNQPYDFMLSLGQSDALGIYQSRLYPEAHDKAAM